MPAEKRERRAEITYILCIACLVPPPLHSFVTSSFCLPAISTIFHSKNPLHDASVLSFLLAADFCLTRHSPVFVCNTALLYTVFFCSVRSPSDPACLPCAATRVGGGWHPSGIVVAEVPREVQHASSARTSPRRVLGWPDPVSRLVVLCPNFD